MPFLRTHGAEGFKDGVWCPLQFIEPFTAMHMPLSFLKRRLKWVLRPGDDPYERHCSFGHLRRDIATLMEHPKADVEAIDPLQQVALLSPFALSALLSVSVATKAVWALPTRQFDSEDRFVALDPPPPGGLDVLVRFKCANTAH